MERADERGDQPAKRGEPIDDDLCPADEEDEHDDVRRVYESARNRHDSREGPDGRARGTR